MNRIKDAGQQLQDACYHAAYHGGWWHDLKTGKLLMDEPNLKGYLVATRLMLIVSEVAEAMEGHRKNLPDDKLPHRLMVEVELADAAIRIFDLAGAMGLDIGSAIAEKLAYNAQRADHKPANRIEAGGKSY